MIDGVKRFTEVKEDEEGKLTAVNGRLEVMGYFKEGRLRGVGGTETRLEGIKSGLKVRGNLGLDYTLKRFREVGENGYWTEVARSGGIWNFVQGMDDSYLP